MQFFASLATLAALCSSVLGAPAISVNAVQANTTGSHYEPLYFLKTVVKYPNPLHRFATSKDQLYLTPYHYAAGLAMASLNRDRDLAYPGRLRKDTQFEFEIHSTARYLSLDYPTEIDNWFPARYSASGHRTPGFFVNMTEGLQWKSEARGYAGRPWQGWLACDSSFGQPQLFWWSPKDGGQSGLPTSCDIVTLMMERA